MIRKIKKRDGKIDDFNPFRITNAIWKAAQAVGGKDHHRATELTEKVLDNIEKGLKPGEIPTVEHVQDTVEKVLIEDGHAKTAKAYILYRHQHEDIREIGGLLQDIDVVDGYLSMMDWKVNENSNMSYSLQGLNVYATENIISNYWLHKIYPPEIGEAHANGGYHIHDLGTLGPYCIGWDLQDILMKGFKGVSGKIESKPAKHFGTALMQIVNYLYTLQGEAAGAQALSNFDTLLAPFIRHDDINYKQVKQEMQKFMYNMNVPTRVGFQSPFSNITLDLTVPSYMKDEPVLIGGQPQETTYKEYSEEMDMINQTFAEIMIEGDAHGRPFTFPIPTYNITADFDWEDEKLDSLWEMTAKYGIPYFSNFINSDMSPEDARSMCCRLRLDNRELRKRGGGLFGANPKTGSIGVVTINLPRIGYLAKDETDFFNRLDTIMNLAKESLIIKREVIENLTEIGLHPYSRFYLHDIKKAYGQFWKNHFSTIGVIGMNDALLNFMGKSIGDPEGKAFAEKVMDHMRDKIADYQEETSDIFNLEATPAEGSLAPDETVLVAQSDPRFCEIGPLIDRYLVENEKDICMVGTSEVLKIPHGTMFTYGFSKGTQKIKKYPVTALVRHPAKSMYEITTLSGRKVRVTGQHSVFTINDDGTPEEIVVRDMEPNDSLAIPKKIEMETVHTEYNVIDMFKNSEIKEYLYGVFPHFFVEDLINRSDVKQWCDQNYTMNWKDVKYMFRKKGIVPLKLVYDLNVELNKKVLKAARMFYRRSKNTVSLNVLIPVDKQFGFIIGSLLSEGWFSERCEFRNTDKKFAEQFIHAVEETFGKGSAHFSSTVRKKPRKPIYTVTLSKSIGLFLKEIGFQGHSHEKKIPNFIFQTSDECVAGLLQGYYYGDGSFYEQKEKTDYSVRLYTSSKELSEGLNLLLLRLGILTKIRVDNKPAYNPQWKKNYVVSISGAANLETFFQVVLNEKNAFGKTHSSREVIPIVPKILKQIMKKYALDPQDLHISKDSFNRNLRKGTISYQFLEEIVQKLSEYIPQYDERFEKLKILVNSDIYWDKVKEVKEVTPPKHVYDFEVDIKGDQVNNFVGGSGLICLHNTSYRLARVDKKEYPDIQVYNQENYRKKGDRAVEPYYTNSTQLPVGFTTDVFEALGLQDTLQTKYTGGTVLHIFLGEDAPDPTAVKNLVRKVAENYELPYYTITPTFSICPEHGYIAGEHELCPRCKEEGKTTACEVYSRVVGYLRPVNQWNKGKQQEFADRKAFVPFDKKQVVKVSA